MEGKKKTKNKNIIIYVKASLSHLIPIKVYNTTVIENDDPHYVVTLPTHIYFPQNVYHTTVKSVIQLIYWLLVHHYGQSQKTKWNSRISLRDERRY